MLGTMPGTRRQGGQRRQWIDNITQWAEKGLVDIVRLAEDREGYRRFVFGAVYARLPGTAHSDARGRVCPFPGGDDHCQRLDGAGLS